MAAGALALRVGLQVGLVQVLPFVLDFTGPLYRLYDYL